MNRNRRAISLRHHEDVAPLLESARYLVLVSVNNLTGEYDQKRVTRRRLNRSSIMGPPLSKPFNGPLYVTLCDYTVNPMDLGHIPSLTPQTHTAIHGQFKKDDGCEIRL